MAVPGNGGQSFARVHTVLDVTAHLSPVGNARLCHRFGRSTGAGRSRRQPSLSRAHDQARARQHHQGPDGPAASSLSHRTVFGEDLTATGASWHEAPGEVLSLLFR